MAGNLITSLLSLATNLLPSITASAQAPSSSSSTSNNSERERARAFQEDLEKLMQTLKRIKATLYDAEEREIRDRSIKLWLKELKKVAYDAEDVLSEYRYEVTCLQVEAGKSSKASGSHKRKKMEYIVQIPYGMVDRLIKIRSRFDEIAKDREALQLRESDGVRCPNNKISRPPTGHMVDEANIFGRDLEIEQVIYFLLSEKEKSFSVISIIGKGGLGKTTIAQLVYKDERITQCFDLFGWVCVSQEFDVGRLTKAIIESVTKINCGLSELSSLQKRLAKIVKGKTIVLILDDVWNENQSVWELLRVPFKEVKMVRIQSSECCKLHDIIHDLARLQSENEHYSVDINQPLGIQERKILREAYHVYASSFMVYVNQILLQNQGLRTLSTDLKYCNHLAIWNLTKFEALRVLELKGYRLPMIPDFISKLKNLAYLSITSLVLKMLPSSIGDLLNLQFLYIQSQKLVDYVPHGLVNFPAIKIMSAQLRVKTIAWLKDMMDFEGNLSIYGVSNLKDTQRANMRNKYKLESLALCRNPHLFKINVNEQSWLRLILEPKPCEDECVGVDDADFAWFDSLQPHSNIKKLRVTSYSSAMVPGWMRDSSSLQSIQEISLNYFENILSLPFCNLHSTLKQLTIAACHSIRVLRLEQLPSQLKELQISLCDNLEFITGLGDLYVLAKLKIWFCEVLKSITMNGLQLVEPTEPIGDSSHKKPDIGRNNISSLTSLEIGSCSSLCVLPNELIPSGHSCYVKVQGCGCTNIETKIYNKSNQRSIQ